MSRDLANQILLEASRIHNKEQKRQAEENAMKAKERVESTSAWLRLEAFPNDIQGLDEICMEQWQVHKDLQDRAYLSLTAGPKIFEVTYSSATASDIAQTFKSRRKAFIRHNPHLLFDTEDVDISVTYDRQGCVKLNLESNLEQLVSSIDLIMQVYLSGDLQRS